LTGIGQNVEFGKDGLRINGNLVNGYFEVFLADGTTRAKLRVGAGTDEADAVNLGQLNLKLDANKVVTDIEAAAGYIADAPTVKAAIAAQISALIGSAPEAYDTLQEIASWIGSHQDLYEALITTVGNKLDASKVTTDISATAGNVPDAPTVKSYVDQEVGAVEADVTNLQTLSGVADDSSDLGTFTGSIIADNTNVKDALQALETAVEDIAGMDTCRELDFDYTSTFPLNIGSVIPSGAKLDRIKIGITTPFNDMAASASVGTDANNALYMTTGDINLRSAIVSKVDSTAKFNTDTQLKLYLNKGTSTAGSGSVLVFFC
jgi:hypothetical protein